MSGSTQILAPFLPKIVDGLLTMATQSTDDVLALVLESLRIVMSVRKETRLNILMNFAVSKTITRSAGKVKLLILPLISLPSLPLFSVFRVNRDWPSKVQH